MANKSVLIVTHNMAAMGGGGGVEVYQEFLRDLPDYDVSFLFRVRQDGKRFWKLQHPDGRISTYPFPSDIPPIWLRSEAAEKTFASILQEHKFDLIHFQHLLWHPMSLPIVAQNIGIPTIYTLHDHFLVCSQFNLIGIDSRYCDTFNEPIKQCDYCLKAKHNFPFGTQEKRRNFVNRVANNISAFIANTPWTKDNFLKTYPDVRSDKISVIEMLKPPHSSPIIQHEIPELPDDDFLKVAIPGNFNYLKGGDTIVRLIEGMKEEKIHFTILGSVQEQKYSKLFEKLTNPKVKVLGKYEAKDIVPLLSNFDATLHLSIWPETYMITLSEAWAAGAIPIVTNLGAPGERVTNGYNGYIVKPHSIGAIHDTLQRLSTDAELRKSLQANIENTHIESVSEHLLALGNLYSKTIR